MQTPCRDLMTIQRFQILRTFCWILESCGLFWIFRYLCLCSTWWFPRLTIFFKVPRSKTIHLLQCIASVWHLGKRDTLAERRRRFWWASPSAGVEENVSVSWLLYFFLGVKNFYKCNLFLKYHILCYCYFSDSYLRPCEILKWYLFFMKSA